MGKSLFCGEKVSTDESMVWQYIGKIGALVGGDVNPFGGDIGFELSGAFAGIV